MARGPQCLCVFALVMPLAVPLVAGGQTPHAIYFDTNGGGFSFSLSVFCSFAFYSVFINLVLLGRRGCALRG